MTTVSCTTMPMTTTTPVALKTDLKELSKITTRIDCSVVQVSVARVQPPTTRNACAEVELASAQEAALSRDLTQGTWWQCAIAAIQSQHTVQRI